MPMLVPVSHVIGVPGAKTARLTGEETHVRSAGCIVSCGSRDGLAGRADAGFARRARDGSQGLLVPGPRTHQTLSSCSARRADGVRCVHVVGPPGRRKIQKRGMGSGLHNQGLKPLATNARPTGEERTVDNERVRKRSLSLRQTQRALHTCPRSRGHVAVPHPYRRPGWRTDETPGKTVEAWHDTHARVCTFLPSPTRTRCRF